jgi:hypothetical protein
MYSIQYTLLQHGVVHPMRTFDLADKDEVQNKDDDLVSPRR